VKISVVTTGDDILKGKTLNTNFNYLAQRVFEKGVEIRFEISVPDREDRISEALDFLRGKTDGAVIIGGLGPTHDDRTREGLAKFIKENPFFDKGLWEKLKKIEPELDIEKHGKYAWNFKRARLLDNPTGIARGYLYEKNNFFIFLLPGPPREFIPMVEKHVLPYLEKRTGKEYRTKVIKTFGLKEIEIMQKIKQREEFLKPFSILPAMQEVRVVLYGKEKELEEKITVLKELLNDFIYTEEDERIEEVVGKILKTRKLTLSTAESCTGGLLGDIITRVPGSSDYYKGGIIAYSEKIKTDILKVNQETIKKFSVYSGEVAKEMAEKVKKIFNTDIGISTTGIAGPSGGTPEKPVGLIYMGFSYKDKNFVLKEIFKGSREEIKLQAVCFILNELRKKFKEEKR
jgi:nicotinamide-nucleotide amidase